MLKTAAVIKCESISEDEKNVFTIVFMFKLGLQLPIHHRESIDTLFKKDTTLFHRLHIVF